MLRKLLSHIVIVTIAFTGLFPPCLSFAQEQNEYTIAVLDLQANGVSFVEARVISEKIRTRISWLTTNSTYRNNSGTDKYSVVERTQMDMIFEQFDIQNTGCIDTSCAIEFGKMLQVDRIIIGSVNLLGNTYNVTTRTIDIESSKTLTVTEVDYRGSIDGLLGSRIEDMADELLLGSTFKEWENSEIFSVSGNPPDAAVKINRKKVGNTPIQNIMVQVGTNSVQIRKSGYEDYVDRINIKKGAPFNLNYTLFPKTRKRTVFKSLYFPGSGQRYADYKVKGYLITLLQVATVAGLVETTMIFMDAQSEYDDAKDVYYKSVSQSNYDTTYNIVQEKYDDVKQANTFQMISAGAVVAVYLYNIIDAALTVPQTEDQFAQKTILIEPKLSQECSSITVSLRF